MCPSCVGPLGGSFGPDEDDEDEDERMRMRG